jgi:transposase
MLYVGVDWGESHHDVVVMDEAGRVLGTGRVSEGLEGVRRLHELVGEHLGTDDPAAVVVGIETERGLLVRALVGAGYAVYAPNPLAVSRYRQRHAVSGAKSDGADAKVLADLVRTDRHNHRTVRGDSELAEAVRVLARAHQSFVWQRQRHLNALRSALREYFPAALAAFGSDLGHPDALAVLGLAPAPVPARALSRAKIAAALRRGGRQRRLEQRAAEIQGHLRAEHAEAPAVIASAFGRAAEGQLALIRALDEQIAALEAQLAERFDAHPDAEILRSLPGLGPVLGARVLAEFGDDPTRFADPRGRKNYAGMAPITRESGRSRVVLARHARNRHLADACFLWAFCSLTRSPGARRYYDTLRHRGKTHRQAVRQLANRWVGVLHGCLERRELYHEAVAWPPDQERLSVVA